MKEFLKALDEKIGMYEINEATENKVVIEIIWGDWKHDHLRANWIASEYDYRCTDEYETESDDSDCYSAVHVYER